MRITVKLGGSILEDGNIRMRLLEQIAGMSAQSNEIILVHGGGKSLNRRLAQMQMESHFIEGLRVTDAQTLGVAVMVLAGEVNKTIVAELSKLKIEALGICGADAGAVRCTRLSGSPGYPAGIGFVGEPAAVNRPFFDLILHSGRIPVVASIGLGENAQLYNVNADQMAAACASGTHCDCLIYLTDVPGVKDENGSVIPSLGEEQIVKLRAGGILSGGMLPKTSSCLEALKAGVHEVYILPGASPDILKKFSERTLAEGTSIHESN